MLGTPHPILYPQAPVECALELLNLQLTPTHSHQVPAALGLTEVQWGYSCPALAVPTQRQRHSGPKNIVTGLR